MINSALRFHRAVFVVVVVVSWYLSSGATVRAQPLQQEALGSPSLTAAASGASAIEVSWTPVTGAARYELWVWWDDESGWQRLDSGDLTGTSFAHSGLTPGRTYYYVVAGIDQNSVRGAWSSQVPVTLPSTSQALPAPTVAATSSGADSIAVTWNQVAGASRYELWFWVNRESGWQQLDDGSLAVTSFSHTGLSAGSTYYYAAAAVDANALRGAWSTLVSATVPGTSGNLDAPTLTATSRLTSTVELNWTAVPNASRYALYTWWGATTGWQKLDDGNLTATTYVHSGVTSGLTYYYTVAALDGAGVLGAWAQNASVTVPESPANPDLPAERAALSALYNATDGPNWARNANWLSESSIATWHGVVTNEEGRVIELSLASNGLQGTIPSLSALTELRILSLGSNRLSGSVPDLSYFANLVALDFDSNQMTGSIPDLSALTALEWLSLSNNQFSGQIPALSSLTGLTILDLSNNQLTGSIPSVNALTQLGSLSLSGNELSGSIPDLSALTDLTDLHLGANKLNGPIPDLSALTGLRSLSLSDNELSGAIPDLGNLSNLAVLEIGNNRLSGSAPDLSAHTSLRLLNLGHNQLSGPLPDLSALTNLTELSMPNNQFTGSITNLNSLSKLSWLDLSDNQLTGSLPDPSSLTALTRMGLSHNQLSGTIPSLSRLSKLLHLDLGSNQLTGTVSDLSQLTSLTSLILASNQLSGPVPDLSALTKLAALDLSANQFCLPADYDLTTLGPSAAAHLTSLNLPDCATGRSFNPVAG